MRDAQVLLQFLPYDNRPPPVAVPHDTLTRQKKDTESTARRYTAIVDKKSVRAKGLKLSASTRGHARGLHPFSCTVFGCSEAFALAFAEHGAACKIIGYCNARPGAGGAVGLRPCAAGSAAPRSSLGPRRAFAFRPLWPCPQELPPGYIFVIFQQQHSISLSSLLQGRSYI